MFPKIQNVVASAYIPSQSHFNMKMIASKIQSSRYNPKRFPAVILRRTKPKGTALFFNSGKVIILGCQSIPETEILAKKLAKDICKISGKNLLLENFRITNLVATGEVGFLIDIGKVAQDAIGAKDDNFPGLVYKMGSPVKSVLIFSSGKIIMTGAVTTKQIDQGYNQIIKSMRKYQINKRC